jgi:hypothetical protein
MLHISLRPEASQHHKRTELAYILREMYGMFAALPISTVNP